MGQTKPNCFIVGAAKSGTTYLAEVLGNSQDIYVPAKKEFHYYADDLNNNGLRVESRDKYLGYYSRGADRLWRVDASTSYLYSAGAAYKIHDEIAAARIIIMLRNPVDRAYSMYWHHRLRGYENLEFEKALRAEKDRVANNWPWVFHYLQSGLYSEQINRYMDIFPKENIYIFFSEDIFSDGKRVIGELLSWLSLANEELSLEGARNKTGQPRIRMLSRLISPRSAPLKGIAHLAPEWLLKLRRKVIAWNAISAPLMQSDTRKYLDDYFKADMERFERLTGMRAPW